MSLDALLRSNRLWRAGEHSAQVAALSTGYRALDGLLPGGGWPDSGLVELLPARSGIGELGLLMPALAGLSRGSRWIAWVAPPYLPYAPALAAAGIDLSRVLMVYPRDSQDGLWALEQVLRAGTCAAVLAWPQTLDARAMRRLQLAAEAGGCVGFLFRKDTARQQPSAVQLRLQLDCPPDAKNRELDMRRLSVDILKRRGGWPVGPVTLAVQSAAALKAECPPASVA